MLASRYSSFGGREYLFGDNELAVPPAEECFCVNSPSSFYNYESDIYIIYDPGYLFCSSLRFEVDYSPFSSMYFNDGGENTTSSMLPCLFIVGFKIKCNDVTAGYSLIIGFLGKYGLFSKPSG